MARMSFDHDWATRSPCGDDIIADHGNGERKITCSEDANGAHGPKHPSQVGLGRTCLVSLPLIDNCIHPTAFFHQIGEDSQLKEASVQLHCQSSVWVAGFQACTVK